MSVPTIKDVAAAAGVSTAAVSLYLNDRAGISQTTRDRIAATIKSLGYVPRANGRRNAGEGYVGMLVEELPLPIHSDHFYAQVLRGIHAEAERLGYNLVLSVLDQTQAGLPRVVAEQHVAGLLAIGGGDITDDLLNRLAGEEIALVAVDNYSLSRHIDSVVTDDQTGGYLATRHLIELGHRRIAMILGPEKYKPLVERYLGYRQALREAGIPIDEALMQPSISRGTPRKGYREMQQLLTCNPPPTAVFAVTDRTALGALDAIYEYGLRVPDDISLIGFDDIAPGAQARPPLSTIHRPNYEMGVAAMRRLDTVIAGQSLIPMKLVLYNDLVVRASTAPPPEV
jgi:DNA-binding LacI/PurR family transcriptional regulator